MALDTQISTAARNAALDAVAALMNGGFLRVYDGTKPAGPGTAITTQVLLSEHALSATAFAAASGGSAVANAIADDTSANAGGNASWARFFASNGTTAVMDVTVGTATSNLIIANVTIVAGATVKVTGYTLTMPAAGA